MRDLHISPFPSHYLAYNSQFQTPNYILNRKDDTFSLIFIHDKKVPRGQSGIPSVDANIVMRRRPMNRAILKSILAAGLLLKFSELGWGYIGL